jgi:hypothetical protein
MRFLVVQMVQDSSASGQQAAQAFVQDRIQEECSFPKLPHTKKA